MLPEKLRPRSAAQLNEPCTRWRVRSSGILEVTMGRGLLLWIIGIPLPIILLVWLFGGLS
jgi:hypothetical protein